MKLNEDGTAGAKVNGEVIFRVPELRDMMAMAALQGLLAYNGDCSTPATVVRRAYQWAEEMLEERKK